MCSCNWQKQQYFEHVHCVSVLSHCEQSVATTPIPRDAPSSRYMLCHLRSFHKRGLPRSLADNIGRRPDSQQWVFGTCLASLTLLKRTCYVRFSAPLEP